MFNNQPEELLTLAQTQYQKGDSAWLSTAWPIARKVLCRGLLLCKIYTCNSTSKAETDSHLGYSNANEKQFHCFSGISVFHCTVSPKPVIFTQAKHYWSQQLKPLSIWKPWQIYHNIKVNNYREVIPPSHCEVKSVGFCNSFEQLITI